MRSDDFSARFHFARLPMKAMRSALRPMPECGSAGPAQGDWTERLQRARTRREIILVVQEYLSEWEPIEMARIPRACRPFGVALPRDVVHLALGLTRQGPQPGDHPDDIAALERMAALFSRAAARLAQAS